jgi:hypothetical protein
MLEKKNEKGIYLTSIPKNLTISKHIPSILNILGRSA